MFEDYFKKRKIKKYARKLPFELRNLYGKSEYYTKGQVDRAIKNRVRITGRGGVIISDVCFAYAMFCSPEEFIKIHEELDESCDYSAMRAEISNTCFAGDDFSFSTLVAHTDPGVFGGDSDGSDTGD